jgi:hypothetical protein
MTNRISMAGLVALLALHAAAIGAQTDAKKGAAEKPIAALAWLAGGVWTADASKAGGGGGGLQRIETRYQWSDNDAYLRFNTHFITDKATIRNYDGSFYWDPEQSTLAMWYMDAKNSITMGPVKFDGTTMEMTFRATNFEDKMSDMRVKVTRKTNDDYTWALEEKVAEGWKQLLALEYVRSGGH